MEENFVFIILEIKKKETTVNCSYHIGHSICNQCIRLILVFIRSISSYRYINSFLSIISSQRSSIYTVDTLSFASHIRAVISSLASPPLLVMVRTERMWIHASFVSCIELLSGAMLIPMINIQQNLLIRWYLIVAVAIFTGYRIVSLADIRPLLLGLVECWAARTYWPCKQLLHKQNTSGTCPITLLPGRATYAKLRCLFISAQVRVASGRLYHQSHSTT